MDRWSVASRKDEARDFTPCPERLLLGAVRPLRRGERGERLTADARALTCSQCPVSKGLFGPIPKRTSDCCWPEVVSAPDGDDIAWFASTLEDVADGVGRADYEPMGLLGTGACSYCPDRVSRGPTGACGRPSNGRRQIADRKANGDTLTTYAENASTSNEVLGEKIGRGCP